MNEIGPLKDSDAIEDAVVERLRLWMPSYTAEVERQKVRQTINAVFVSPIGPVTFTATGPDGNDHVYTFGVDPELTGDMVTGEFTVSFVPDVPGDWTWVFNPGGIGAILGEFTVRFVPGALPAIRGVIPVSQLALWPENQLPFIVVVAPGTTEEPRKDGDGNYSARFSVGVAVIVNTADQNKSRTVAKIYGSAARGCLLQRRSLSDKVEVTDWLGESLDDVNIDERRSLFGTVNMFEIELRDMVSWKRGPSPVWTDDGPVEATPPVDPLTPFNELPTVETIEMEVNEDS